MSKPLNSRQHVVALSGLTPTGANTYVASIVPSSSKALRVTGLTIWNPGKVTAAQVTDLSVVFQTTAASGGTVATVVAEDGTPLPGTVRTGGFTPGTAGALVKRVSVFTPTALAAFNPPLKVTFEKPVVLPAGSRGALLRVDNGASGYTDLDVTIDVEG